MPRAPIEIQGRREAQSHLRCQAASSPSVVAVLPKCFAQSDAPAWSRARRGSPCMLAILPSPRPQNRLRAADGPPAFRRTMAAAIRPRPRGRRTSPSTFSALPLPPATHTTTERDCFPQSLCSLSFLIRNEFDRSPAQEFHYEQITTIQLLRLEAPELLCPFDVDHPQDIDAVSRRKLQAASIAAR